MGNLADLHRLRASVPLDWTTVLLWIPREVCVQRAANGEDSDTAKRLIAWDETKTDLDSANIPMPHPHRPDRARRGRPTHHQGICLCDLLKNLHAEPGLLLADDGKLHVAVHRQHLPHRVARLRYGRRVSTRLDLEATSSSRITT